jgi:hypothetical protein
MTREIPLNGARGGVALVSDEDYDRLSAYRWHQGKAGYVESSFRVNGKTRTVRMHRLVMDAGAGQEVDHRNRNKLDNRRENLRLVTSAINKWNVERTTLNKTGHRGAQYRRRSGRWAARIIANGRCVWLGTFDTPEDAAHAYEIARHARDEQGAIPEAVRHLRPAGWRKPALPCRVCGKVVTYRTRERCDSCYHHLRKWGKDKEIAS